MDHVALDRPRADQRHLDHQVVEAARLQARQHVDLRPAFDLEHADAVALAQHVVNRRILGRDGVELIVAEPVQPHQVEALADAGQHAERQHIDLHQAERVDVVLVPFDEGAVLHRGIVDRDDLVEPSFGQHIAADMLRQMAGEAQQPVDQRLASARSRGWRASGRPRRSARLPAHFRSCPRLVLASRAVTSSDRPSALPTSRTVLRER